MSVHPSLKTKGAVAEKRNVMKRFERIDALKADSDDEAVGLKIVRSSLEQPLRWLVKNSGADDGWVVRKVLDEKSATYGFNASTLEFGDMLEMGVLDPVKVTRHALQNAASVASMILTTECLVTDIKEDLPAPPMGGAPGGMPGMM